MSPNLYSTREADSARAASYRIAAAVRQLEDLIPTSAVRPVSAKAWEDLKWAADRLAVLVARYEPADPETDKPRAGGPPPRISAHRRGIDAGQARAAAGTDQSDAPIGRHPADRENTT